MVIQIPQLTGDYIVSTVKTHINKQQEQETGNAIRKVSSHASRTHINKSETLWYDTLQAITTSIMEYIIMLKNASLNLPHFIMDIHISFFNLGIWQVRAGRGFATCLWNWDKKLHISSANSYQLIVTINFNWLHLKDSSPETNTNVFRCWDDWSSMNRSSRMYMQYAFKGTVNTKM